MNSPIEEIKSRLDIAEFIQQYIRLQKAGVNYKANCPFHTEKTPSFFVSPARQIWHCFGGCGEGGDIFKFVMKIEGLDFPEALKLLAQRAGVVLKREDPALRSERNRLYDISEEAAGIFEKSLSLTPRALAYLKKRGVSEDTIKEFRIGFAPQSWDFLLRALSQKGFEKSEIEKAGLAIKSEEKSSHYDRFRSRIMFPIMDGNSRVVGFSGRIFEIEPPPSLAGRASFPQGGEVGSRKSEVAKVEAKYVNTPNTLIYDKSRILYGFDKAKQEIRTKNKVVLVEGQMDCVMSNQAGIKNTIAVSGTALTREHLETLKRLCDTVVTSFDTDAAGDSATKRSLALAAQFEFKRNIAKIPSGKDPADTVLENPESWRNAVEKAQDIVSFYFEKLFSEHDPSSVEGKKIIASQLLPFISELTDEIEKAHWVGLVAGRFGVEEQAVWKELARKNQKIVPGEKTFGVDTKRIPTRRDLLEEHFLTLLAMLKDEAKISGLKERHLTFGSSLNQELFDWLSEGAVSSAEAPHLREVLELLKFKGEILSQTLKDIDAEFVISRQELEKEGIKERLLKLGEEIRRKESEGDITVLSALLQDFRALSEKLKTASPSS